MPKEIINLAQKKGGGEISWRNLEMLKSVGIDKEGRWKIKQERLSFGGKNLEESAKLFERKNETRELPVIERCEL